MPSFEAKRKVPAVSDSGMGHSGTAIFQLVRSSVDDKVECRRLYEAVVKNPDDTIAVAMRIWVERIRNVIEFRNHLTALKSDLF